MTTETFFDYYYSNPENRGLSRVSLIFFIIL